MGEANALKFQSRGESSVAQASSSESDFISSTALGKSVPGEATATVDKTTEDPVQKDVMVA